MTPTARAAGVFLELSRLIGPKSGTGRLFIYDTNRDGGVLFQATSECFDYVLVQSYGRSASSLQSTWDFLAPFIDPEQYLIGFSFYEENDDWNEWNDTSEPFGENSAGLWSSPMGSLTGRGRAASLSMPSIVMASPSRMMRSRTPRTSGARR